MAAGYVLISRIKARIKKLSGLRNRIVNNSTLANIHKKKDELADLDSRIEELGKLLHGKGHKTNIKELME